jgi:hypothetical protein
LFTEATGSFDDGNAAAWEGVNGQPLVAQANDIVEYDGSRWQISFDSPQVQIIYSMSQMSPQKYNIAGLVLPGSNHIRDFIKEAHGA